MSAEAPPLPEPCPAQPLPPWEPCCCLPASQVTNLDFVLHSAASPVPPLLVMASLLPALPPGLDLAQAAIPLSPGPNINFLSGPLLPFLRVLPGVIP